MRAVSPNAGRTLDAARSARHFGGGALGGVVGGLAGATTAVAVTMVIKTALAVVSNQGGAWIFIAPLVGVAIAVIVLRWYRHGEALQQIAPEEHRPVTRQRLGLRWRDPRGVIRADLTADVLAAAGQEERFPWRLAPIRAVAIIATVGLGAPMGTESPAAHLGMAAGAGLMDRLGWRRLIRSAAVSGGAAGVSALVGIPLVGTAFVLELGRRRLIPISLERLTAAVAGGLIGWAINRTFGLDLIRLNVPEIAPGDIGIALTTALVAGASAGTITSLTGAAIYAARGWTAHPAFRLAAGAAVMTLASVAVAFIATPSAAVGPGAGAAAWAATTDAPGFTLIVVALLRAVATTAAVAAGGCGGVFVPFLAIGDITGRSFASLFGVPGGLAGSAGAAGGIAGGYRLPFTAAMMVLGLGGPYSATVTCLATVAVATAAGAAASLALDWFSRPDDP